jgi:plastocyanin
MKRSRLSLLGALAVVVLAATGCGGGDDENGSATTPSETSTSGSTNLIGSVGSQDDPDAYEISLITGDGDEVTHETTTVTAGEYTLEINDRSSIHNFHLRGPQVDVATDVAGKGEKTATVILDGDGSYTYLCDAHPTSMKVEFIVRTG